MKKSVLSIVAIAFAAVSVLSSCDKNDDGYGQSAKTETVASQSTVKAPKDVEFVVIAEANQGKYLNETYTLDVNGKEMTVAVSQMVEVSKADSAAYVNASGDRAILSTTDKNHKQLELKIYKINLGSYTGGTFKVKNIQRTVKADHPNTDEMHFVEDLKFYTNADGQLKSQNLVSSVALKLGVYVNELDKLVQILEGGDKLITARF